MNRRTFLKAAGAAAASFTLAGPAAVANAATRKPNFVMIYADDLGYGDLGCFGHPTIHTPNLDRMAVEGAKLTQFYSAAPVCTPSRAALITGRLPIRNGMCSSRRAVLFPDSAGGIPETELTIAEVLKPQGYTSGCFGKWHLGHRPQYLPTSNGFDYYYGIPYSNDMRVDPNMELADEVNFREGMTAEKLRNDKPKGHWVPLMRNKKVIEYPADQHTITKRFTEEAVGFIENAKAKDKPFFIYLAHNMPHIPLFASDDFDDTSRRGLYGDVIQEVDWSVGQILDTLRKLKIDRDTLVIFSSDNGPWLVFKQDGGSGGLLRDGKGSTWEGGMREPTVAWWPGAIPAGQVCMDMTSTLDVLPTFAELAGASLPTDRIYDGYSMVPLLTGKGKGKRNTMPYYRGQQLRAFRKGPWKIHMVTKTEYVGQKPVEHDPPLLFNVEIDPSEKYNVAGKHPDIVADLLQEVEKHKASIKPYPSQLETRIKS